MDPRYPAQPFVAPVNGSMPQQSMTTDPSNPFVAQYSMPAAGNPFLGPQTSWQQQQQPQQPLYPYVPQQGLPDTLPSQQRDTSSPVSRSSSSIPVSYPVISQASLDKVPKQPKQQAPLFPDIQLNKDAALRPVLSVPPVAVTQETTRPGRSRL